MLIPTTEVQTQAGMPLQGKDIPNPPQPPDDVRVAAIITQDITNAESIQWRKRLPTMWADNNNLYNFVLPTRVWPGTKIQRSTLGVPLVLEHINTINSQVMDVMFEEDPPFFPMPYSGTLMNESRAAAEIINWQLKQTDAENEIEVGSHNTLLHGTNIWKAYWKKVNGKWQARLESIEREHVFIDPSLRVPDVRKAKWVAHRMYYTLEYIDKLRDDDSFKNIPSIDVLKSWATDPKETPPASRVEADLLYTFPEFQSEERQKPGSVDPMLHPFEVIEYVNKRFVHTILNRKIVIRSVDNSKKDKVRFFNAFFIRIKGQFDSHGIGALIGNEQRLQQGLVNGIIDNLNLSMHGIFKQKRGSTLFPQMTKLYPGAVIPVDEINDFDAIQLPGLKADVFNEINNSDSRAQRRTGANQVTVQGSLPQTSGGIGRTAAGMNAMAQASGGLIRRYVRILEKQVFVPFLEFLNETNDQYLSPDIVKNLLSTELQSAYYKTDTQGNPLTDANGQPKTVNVDQVLAEKLDFRMFASTKMKRRSIMLQAVPELFQFFMQPAIQDALKGQFKKLDIMELIRMMMDASGWPSIGSLVQDMDKTEAMKVASENPLVQELLKTKAMIQLQTQGDVQTVDAKSAGRAFNTFLKAGLDQHLWNAQQATAIQQALGQMAGQEAYGPIQPSGGPVDQIPNPDQTQAAPAQNVPPMMGGM